MPVNVNNINEIRVGVLGYSVDESSSGPGDGQWTSTGPEGGRNTLNTTQRIINRAINLLDTQIKNALDSSQGFDDRFTAVVGDEEGVDQAAFNSIGSNLIQAISGLTGAFTDHLTGIVWTVAHNLNEQYVLVQVINDSGNIVIPDVEYTDADTCTLRFVKPTTGTVKIRK